MSPRVGSAVPPLKQTRGPEQSGEETGQFGQRKVKADTSQTTYGMLPVEMWEEIISYTDLKDRPKVYQVSKFFKSVCEIKRVIARQIQNNRRYCPIPLPDTVPNTVSSEDILNRLNKETGKDWSSYKPICQFLLAVYRKIVDFHCLHTSGSGERWTRECCQ